MCDCVLNTPQWVWNCTWW